MRLYTDTSWQYIRKVIKTKINVVSNVGNEGNQEPHLQVATSSKSKMVIFKTITSHTFLHYIILLQR